MAAGIRINYTDVMRKAQKLHDQADNLYREKRSVEAIYQQVQSHWESPASRSYCRKMEALLVKMEQNLQTNEKYGRSD